LRCVDDAAGDDVVNGNRSGGAQEVDGLRAGEAREVEPAEPFEAAVEQYGRLDILVTTPAPR
jgi:hypothetical protein